MKKIGFFVFFLILPAAFLAGAQALAAKFDFQTFPPGPHFTGIVMQQGAVQLDEDFNETVTLEIFAIDLGLADEVYAKQITEDPYIWIFLGHLRNSGEWESNLFLLDRELYPAVQSGLRVLVDINADESNPTYLAFSQVSAVPVPASLFLLGSGLLGLIGLRGVRHCIPAQPAKTVFGMPF